MTLRPRNTMETWRFSGIALLLFGLGCSPPDSTTSEADVGVDATTPDANGQPDQGDLGCVTQGCPDRLVCNSVTGVCVDCLTNNECGANGTCDPTSNKCSCNAGYHLCDGVCLSDTSVDSCGNRCEPCPTTPNGTASCEAEACVLTCNAPLVLDDGACVGCSDNSHCEAPDASVCSAGGTCDACTDAADCAHIDGRAMCDDGTCVECTDADDAACGGNACGPDGTCTTVPKASVATCGQCTADAECRTGHACVPMEFDGAPYAAHCLPFNTGTCASPLPVAVTRSTVSGTIAGFCTLNEALTTCEGLADYGNPCSDNSDCGAVGLDDGRCEPIDFDRAACTFVCDAYEECPSASLIGCSPGDGAKWCGAY